MPSGRYRSRSRSRGRYSGRKGSRRSRSPYRRHSRSRSARRARRSRSLQRIPHRSPSPQRTRRRSPSPQRTRRRSPSPQGTRRRSPSPRRTRRRSPSPQRTRHKSPSPQRTRHKSPSPQRTRLRSPSPAKLSRRSRSPQKTFRRSKTPERTRRSRTPKRSHCSVSRTPERFHRPAREAQSPESSGSPDDLFTRKKTNLARSHSPANLDDVLMREKALTSNRKPSLSSRYDKYDINVISLHSKGKNQRSPADIDNDSSPSGFFPTDVIELVHELNSSARKKSKSLFDREEIRNFVEVEEVETKVIRLLPSKDEFKELEAKLSKSQSTQSKSRDRSTRGRYSRDRADKLSESSLRREPERRRRHVTDDDLMDVTSSSRGEASLQSDKDHKRSIRERLGSLTRESKSSKRMDERLGRTHDPRDDLRDGDLRRNLSSRSGRDGEGRQVEPVIMEYSHKSLSSEYRDSKVREPTPDFSKRPDKGRVDMKELDPTYVPRGGFYDEHDDRTSDRGSWRAHGDWGGQGYRGRGGRFGRGRGFNRTPYRPMRDDRTERRSDVPRIVDRRPDKSRKSAVSDTWKHDKFVELDEDTKAEPTSTTS